MYIYVKEMLEKIERQNDVKIEAIHRKLDIKEEIESKEQDPERNDQRDLSGMEIMFLTIGVRFIVQTLDLAYAPTSNKSTRAKIFIPMAIAEALFGFICLVVSIMIKIRANSKKWADYVFDLAIVLDVFCVLFHAAELVPLHFLPLTYVADIVVIVIVVCVYIYIYVYVCICICICHIHIHIHVHICKRDVRKN